MGRHTREDSRTAPPKRQRIQPSSLKCLPHNLQEQALLGVHRQCLARTDPEEPRIKHLHTVHEPTEASARNPRPSTLSLPQLLKIPAAITREVRNRVPPRSHEIPQGLRTIHSARK